MCVPFAIFKARGMMSMFPFAIQAFALIMKFYRWMKNIG